jgi:hypothetical protein
VGVVPATAEGQRPRPVKCMSREVGQDEKRRGPEAWAGMGRLGKKGNRPGPRRIMKIFIYFKFPN